jgi:hypothetical protein
MSLKIRQGDLCLNGIKITHPLSASDMTAYPIYPAVHLSCPVHSTIPSPCCQGAMPTATPKLQLLQMGDDPNALNSLSKFTLFETKR